MPESLRQRLAAIAEPLFLVVLGGVVLAWLHGPGVILGVDSYFVLRPELAIHDALSAWVASTSAGMPNFSVQTLPFYSALFLLSHVLGYRAAQIAILWALVSLGALGMRAMLRACFDWDGTWTASISIVAVALIYVFNPFTTSFVWRYQTWMELTWTAFPWLAALLVMGLRGRMTPVRSAAIGSLILVLGGTAFPHILIPGAALMLLVLLAAFVVISADRWKTFRTGITILGWWALSLAWWILPSVVFLHDFMAAWAAQYRANPNQLLDYGSQYASIANVLRFTGLFQLRLSIAGQPLYPWFASFDSTLGLALYALPLLAALGFANALRAQKRERSLVVLLGMLWLVTVFLMKGGHAPLAAVNHALLGLPLGAAWQHPYDKFALPAVFCACLLAASFLRDVIGAGWRGLNIALPAALVLTVAVEGWPAYVGQVLLAQAAPLPGSVAVVPEYYDRLNALLRDVDGSTLQLPLRDNGETAFAWDRGAQTNNDPVIENFNGGRPVIRMRSGFSYADALIDEAREAMRDEKSRARVLSALGFGSIVLHRDWDSRYFPVTPDVPAYERSFKTADPGTPGGITFDSGTSVRGLKLPVSHLDEGNFKAGFTLRMRDVKREQTIFATDNGLEVRWVMPGYFAIFAPAQTGGSVWVAAVPSLLRNTDKSKVVVSIRDGSAEISVDGVLLAQADISRSATAKGVFLGSENRFRTFAGTISDFWLEDERHAISTFSVNDDALRKRAATFGWALFGDGNVPAVIPAGSFTARTQKNAAGIKLPGAQLDGDSFDVAMYVRPDDVTREQVLFSTDSGMAVRWIRPGYLEAIAPFGARIFSAPLRLRSGVAFKLDFNSEHGVARLSVDDVPVAAGPFPLASPSHSLFLGSANRFRPFSGAISDVEIANGNQMYVFGDNARTEQQLKHFGWIAVRGAADTGDMSTHRVGKLDVLLTPCPTAYAYTADAYAGNVQSVLHRDAACGIRVAAVSAPLKPARCSGVKIDRVSPADFSGMDVRTTGVGSCLLTFNTSFSPGWTLRPSGSGKVTAHGVVNGFANGFSIESKGPAVFAFRFQRQPLVTWSLFAGLIMLLANLAIVLWTYAPAFALGLAPRGRSEAAVNAE